MRAKLNAILEKFPELDLLASWTAAFVVIALVIAFPLRLFGVAPDVVKLVAFGAWAVVAVFINAAWLVEEDQREEEQLKTTP